jgi:hypothetical protein
MAQRLEQWEKERDLAEGGASARTGRLLGSDGVVGVTMDWEDVVKWMVTPTTLDRSSSSGSSEDSTAVKEARLTFSQDQWLLVRDTYNRLIHVRVGEDQDGTVLDGSRDVDSAWKHVLNPSLDFADLEARYTASPYDGADGKSSEDDDDASSVVVIDDFLTVEALKELRKACWESTVWHDIKRDYLGAYPENGFAPAPLLRLAQELPAKLPGIFNGTALHTLWGYKYNNEQQSGDLHSTGIALHADDAVVNVNFWITEGGANDDPSSGGMVVYKAMPPVSVRICVCMSRVQYVCA